MAMASEDRGCSCVEGATNSSTCQCFCPILGCCKTVIRNGTNALFWTDKWFMGISLVEMGPSVLQAIPLKTQKMHLVSEALTDHKWISDIHGSLSMVGL
jgi:hypothetical protein